MFTAGDIEKVMEQGGFRDDAMLKIHEIDWVVDQAANAGVIEGNISFWLLKGEGADRTGGLLTYDLDNGLQLSTGYIGEKQLVPTMAGREGIQHILVTVRTEIGKIKDRYWEITGLDAA